MSRLELFAAEKESNQAVQYLERSVCKIDFVHPSTLERIVLADQGMSDSQGLQDTGLTGLQVRGQNGSRDLERAVQRVDVAVLAGISEKEDFVGRNESTVKK